MYGDRDMIASAGPLCHAPRGSRTSFWEVILCVERFPSYSKDNKYQAS